MSGVCFMARPQKCPLRSLSEKEFADLVSLSRSQTAPAAEVSRARALLAVDEGVSFTEAARAAGRRNGDGVAHLVARFNRSGTEAVKSRHGGGPARRYGHAEQERILREVRRPPDRDMDGTATWSLTTLQRALRRAPDGLPTVSNHTIWWMLHDAGYGWQKDRSWCETGRAVRKRKGGSVTVNDPDSVPKKT
jgi:transposase